MNTLMSKAGRQGSRLRANVVSDLDTARKSALHHWSHPTDGAGNYAAAVHAVKRGWLT